MEKTRNVVLGVVLVAAILVLLPGNVNAAVAIFQQNEGNTNLLSEAPDENYGHTGTHQIKNYGGAGRGLLRYDLSSINILGLEISSATLELYMIDHGGGGTQTLSVYEVKAANADWVAGTSNGAAQTGSSCWNKKWYNTANGDWAGSAGCSTAGTDYESTAMSSRTLGTTVPAWYEWTISAAGLDVIEDWADGTKANAGFLLRAESLRRNFRSNWNGGGNAQYRPKLTVTYTPEPATMVLLGMGGIGLLIRRRRRA